MNSRTLNLGNLCVVLGVGLLCFGFYLPYATGGRVHRIEERAIRVARTLLDLARKNPALQLTDSDARRGLVAELNAALDLEDPGSSLYIHLEDGIPARQQDSICLRTKHYLFCLTRTPARYLEGYNEIVSPGRDEQGKPVQKTNKSALPARPFEVYAWPWGKHDGVQAVFFFHATERPSYHRNLSSIYLGKDKPPRPGVAFENNAGQDLVSYRGHDNERWIFRGVGL